MKLVSWNVNGIRACITKGFEESFSQLDADIFCLQETKCQENQVKLELPGYYQYWNYARPKRIFRHRCFYETGASVGEAYGIGIQKSTTRRGVVITAGVV